MNLFGLTHTNPSTFVQKRKHCCLPLIHQVAGVQWFSSSRFLFHRLDSFQHLPLYLFAFSPYDLRFFPVQLIPCELSVFSPPSFSFIRCSALSTFPACISSRINRTLSSCSFRRVFHFRRVSPVYAYSPHLHGMLYTKVEGFVCVDFYENRLRCI